MRHERKKKENRYKLKRLSIGIIKITRVVHSIAALLFPRAIPLRMLLNMAGCHKELGLLGLVNPKGHGDDEQSQKQALPWQADAINFLFKAHNTTHTDASSQSVSL